MKTRKIFAVLCASFLAISAMSAAVSAEESADTTVAEDGDMTIDHVFSRGIWLFTSESGEGTYYIFDDETSGHTDRADGTGGVPFSCEQDGWNITFHFGGPDDTTQAVVDAGDASITFTYEDGTTRTYSIENIDDADPDTFDAGSFVNDNDDPGPLTFRGGIWKYTVKSVDGSVVTEPDGYFRIAEDGKSGEWVDKAFTSEFTLDQSDLSNIKIAINGQDMDGVIQVESDDFDVITAYISIAGNTLLYTFNLVPEGEEDTFIKGFNKSNSAVDAANSKGSPDTGAVDVAAVAGLGILAAGAFIAAKKRK